MLIIFLFYIKHFLADYLLQTEYMLKKFSDKPKEWIPSLLAHSLVHGFFTLVIISLFAPVSFAVIMAVVDVIIHFIVDRIKASPKLYGKYQALSKQEFKAYIDSITEKKINLNNGNGDYEFKLKEIYKLEKEFEEAKKSNKMFWITLGLDQMAHHITDFFIVIITMVYYY